MPELAEWVQSVPGQWAFGHQRVRCEVGAGRKRLVGKHASGERATGFDELQCAIGRCHASVRA